FARRFAQRAVDDRGPLFGAVHAQVHAGGEQRVDEVPGVAHQQPAGAGHARAFVGVVAGDVHGRDALRALHAPCDLRHGVERAQQEAFAVTPAGLEVFRVAHRAHAHVAVGQRDQPEPAVLVAVDADVAGVAAGAALDAAV